jgi:hypothetical protein
MTDIKDKSSINSDENTLKSLWQTVLEQEKEAQWRYPDFLPIFKLRESYQGIEYRLMMNLAALLIASRIWLLRLR